VLAILVTALVAFADPTPPSAGGPAPAAAPAAVASKAKGSDKVCWDEAPTGSHYTRRYCATRDELEQREKQDKDLLNQHTRTTGKRGIGPS
jgi:hypothetical protein